MLGMKGIQYLVDPDIKRSWLVVDDTELVI